MYNYREIFNEEQSTVIDKIVQFMAHPYMKEKIINPESMIHTSFIRGSSQLLEI